jgi:hypothetical protein
VRRARHVPATLFGLKTVFRRADARLVDAAERKDILNRYLDHSRRFDEVAARRSNGRAEVIPINSTLRALDQDPTMREIEVLQLISDGLVNRGIVSSSPRRRSSRTSATSWRSCTRAAAHTRSRSASDAA